MAAASQVMADTQISGGAEKREVNMGGRGEMYVCKSGSDQAAEMSGCDHGDSDGVRTC